MSDPSEVTQANPHPVSQHRTPEEIAADEAGPIGQPDLAVSAKGVSGETGSLAATMLDQPEATAFIDD